MPTCFDVPMIDTIIVEVPNPGHPFGVRGVGEVPIVPPPAAIANAIYDAVGVRMRHLPMSTAEFVAGDIEKGNKSHPRESVLLLEWEKETASAMLEPAMSQAIEPTTQTHRRAVV